jgi:hypothetical protein
MTEAVELSECTWKYGNDRTYETSCGHVWEFFDGGPQENGARYCMYCGKSIHLQELDYKCVNGHDLCQVMLPGPDCPYCERAVPQS